MAEPISSNRAELCERHFKTIGTVVVDQTLADSDSIDYRRYGSGHFTVPTGSTITTLTWHASHSSADGTFVAAYTQANAAVTQTVAASRRYPIPAELAAAHYIRATGNADGQIENVVLKF